MVVGARWGARLLLAGSAVVASAAMRGSALRATPTRRLASHVLALRMAEPPPPYPAPSGRGAHAEAALADNPSAERELRAQLAASHAEKVELTDELRRLRAELYARQQPSWRALDGELSAAAPADRGAARDEGAARAAEPSTVVLRVPPHFRAPEWWASASELETARALELLPRLVSFVSGLEDERLSQLLQLEARLAGVDEGARAVAEEVQSGVEGVWRERVRALEAAANATAADKAALVASFEARVAALDAALGAARQDGARAAAEVRAAAERAAKESGAARAALQTALSALSGENERLKARCEASDAAAAAAAEQAAAAAASAAPLVSAVARGSLAESEVEAVIARALPCAVEDTSHLDGAGDRLVTTPDGMRMLQETKAKERLNPKTDLDKFRADVARGAGARGVNAALFVSVVARTLPNGGPYAVEWITAEVPRDAPAPAAAPSAAAAAAAAPTSRVQVPAVFICTDSADAVALGAQAAHWLCCRAREDAAAARRAAAGEADELRALMDERRALAAALPPIFGRLELGAREADEKLRLLAQLTRLAEAERARHVSMAALVERLSAEVPFVAAPGAAEAAALEAAVSVVLEHMRAHGGAAPKLAELSAAQRAAVTAAGGIASVRAAARERLREEQQQGQAP